MLFIYLRIYEEFVKINVFTPQEFHIFCYIGKNNRSEIFASGIKNHINSEMTLNTISKALQKFEKLKYLEKLSVVETSNLDRRITVYSLTPEGQILYKKIKDTIRPYLQD